MPEPRIVNPGLAACSDRPVAGAAVDAPMLLLELGQSAGSAGSAGSAQSAAIAESAEITGSAGGAQSAEIAELTAIAESAESAHIDPNDPIDPSDPSALAARERWLFRHVTRAGQVHPLRHLLKRYRAGERA